MIKKILTLVLIISKDNKSILLGMKKRGFGKDRWNGFGGKLEEKESIEDAASREVFEEINVKVNGLKKVGVITFYEADPLPLEVHIFVTSDYSGIPKETEEMRPAWFSIDMIPYESMWPDDKYWLPMLLEGKKFKGSFWFEDQDNTDKITKYSLKEASII